MPNHFHLSLGQRADAPLSSVLLRVCTSYAKYFNRKYQHVGHVFQDQFSAVHIEDDTQLAAVSAYIHQNPKVAGLVSDLRQWSYSSYLEYIDGQTGLCDHNPLSDMFKSSSEYERFVEDRYEDIVEHKEIEDLLLD